MTPFECYQKYVAFKNHFNNKKYDYFKSGGAVRVSQKSFENRVDKAFFHRLSKDDKALDRLICFFVFTPSGWIGDVFSREAEYVYKQWKLRKGSLLYYFEEDLKKIKNLKECLTLDGYLPIIFTLYYHGNISFETLTIMGVISNSVNKWEKSLDPLLQDYCLRMKKYHHFLDYNKKKVKNIIKKYINKDEN